MNKGSNISLMIGAVITLTGLIIFFVPFKGAQKAAYGLYLLAGFLYTFLIEESISGKWRKTDKNALTLITNIFMIILPALLVMIQTTLLFIIFSKHGDVMEEKDASGNLPGILTTYNIASFVVILFEMIALFVYASKVVRGKSHPSEIIRAIEQTLTPLFIGLGSLGFLFIGLLYTVITRYITDG